jgi:hypothetical protein
MTIRYFILCCLSYLVIPAFAMGLDIQAAAPYCGQVATVAPTLPHAAIDRLANSHVAVGSKDIAFAWLGAPTRRYPHTALGSTVHAGSASVQLKSGRIVTYVLPLHRVFEDLQPRLIDLDQDGKDELILIESDALLGAALVIFGIRGDALVELARSPHAGSTFRWLNFVGAAEFEGRLDGKLDLAAVITPHIGGVLTLYRYKPPHLVPFAKVMDVSNHKMGSPEQALSAIVTATSASKNQPPTILVPDMSLRALHALRWQSGKWMELSDVKPLPADVQKLVPTINGACALLVDQTWWRVTLLH